ARDAHPWAIILADPGLGKTTLLRFEGWKSIQEQLTGLRGGQLGTQEVLIPLFVRLADLAAEKLADADMARVLVRMAPDPARVGKPVSRSLHKYLGDQISGGRVVLLLDAQDEVSEEVYLRLLPQLRAIEALQPTRLYLTSRIVGYRQNPFTAQHAPELEI